MKTINTIAGEKNVCDLGLIDPHEHIFFSAVSQYPGRKKIYDINGDEDKVCLENVGALRRNCYLLKDNLVIDDFDTQVKELSYFKNAGGNTIIEQTPLELTPFDVETDKALYAIHKLKELSEATGINFILSTGFFTDDVFPARYRDVGEAALSRFFISELTEGIAGSGIKAGVIGEIGTGMPITPTEEMQLRAAALAHNETGAKINIHLYPWGKEALRVLEILKQYNVNPQNICMCHLDVQLDYDHIKEVLDSGAYVEFDDFGKEFYIISEPGEFAGGAFAMDIERVRMLKRLVSEGYEKQLLITNDLCMKSMLHKYGGWGYDHILHNIVPMMRQEGMDSKATERIVYRNPQSFLE